MTLKEWSEQTGIRPTYPTTEKGAVSVICDERDTPRVELYHVTDYKVSSVQGDVIWLVPVVVPHIPVVQVPEEPTWEEHCHGTTSRREEQPVAQIRRRKTVVQMIATKVAAYWNCYYSEKPHLLEWVVKHEEAARDLVKNYLPSGSGFDHGTSLNLEVSTGRILYFKTSFHHMDEHGGYTKWTDHEVIVKPAFSGLDITVRGKDHNGIKDYIAETFYSLLTQDMTDDLEGTGGIHGS